MRILIAEDHPLSLSILRLMLESEGCYEIVEARDGNEAWDQLQKQGGFDLCILDIMMPGIGGLELVERMRADPRLCCQRVLICTASNERSVIAQAAALGVRHYIVKPSAKDHVLKQVRRIRGEVTAAAKFESPARVAARLGIDEEHVSTFIKDLQAEVEALMTALRAESGQAGSALHMKLNSLRGAAINLGVRSLAERLGELEDCCSRGQSICHCEPVLATLEAENQRLSRFLGAQKPVPAAT